MLDYKFYSYDPRLKVELADANGNRRTLHIRKGEGQDLGLEFETYLMDHAHRCANNCVFCFVDQMPKGLRDTLYFKDDDDRLSFLLGNYVTLTNLSPREIQRIIDLRISPINVSVHTTDPELRCREELRPDALVDAILAKRNLGTRITDAPVVVGVGPGFTAGEDCHAVVETMRGHTLGRVIYQGSALPNTNIPGLIGGYAGERVLRAPDDGIFHTVLDIGAQVKSGNVAGEVNGKPMRCTIDGVLRGLLADGTPVFKGMKSGDVDPRCKEEYCYTASDKAFAVGGGVLEAVLHFAGGTGK